MNGRDDEWDDDEDLCEEDEVALKALTALLDVEGDGELAQASREALAVIGDEAMAMKKRRLEAEREAAVARRAAAVPQEPEPPRPSVAPRAPAIVRAARVPGPRREPPRPPGPPRPTAVARAPEPREGARIAPPVSRPVVPVRVPPIAPKPVGLPSVVAASPRAETPTRPTRVPARPAPLPSGTPSRVGVPVGSATALHGRRLPAAPPPLLRPPPTRRGAVAPPKAAPATTGRSLTAKTALLARPAPMPSTGAAQPEEPPPLKGADLLAWRSGRGLNQQGAAARLGISQGTVSKAEARASTVLSPTTRRALAEVLAQEAQGG